MKWVSRNNLIVNIQCSPTSMSFKKINIQWALTHKQHITLWWLKKSLSRVTLTSSVFLILLSSPTCSENLDIIMHYAKLSMWDLSHVGARQYMQPFHWLTQCPERGFYVYVYVCVWYTFIWKRQSKLSTPFQAPRNRHNGSQSKNLRAGETAINSTSSIWKIRIREKNITPPCLGMAPWRLARAYRWLRYHSPVLLLLLGIQRYSGEIYWK